VLAIRAAPTVVGVRRGIDALLFDT